MLESERVFSFICKYNVLFISGSGVLCQLAPMTKQEAKYIRATAVALATVSLFAAPQAIAEASNKVKSHYKDRGQADTLLVECGSSEYRRTELCQVH